MNDKRPWYWVDDEHILRKVDQHQMIEAIQDGAIPTRALTWTDGMPSFVEASSVPELRDACKLAPKQPAALPPPGTHEPPSAELLKAWRRTPQLPPVPPAPPTSAASPVKATVPPPRPGAANYATPSARPPAPPSAAVPAAQREAPQQPEPQSAPTDPAATGPGAPVPAANGNESHEADSPHPPAPASTPVSGREPAGSAVQAQAPTRQPLPPPQDPPVKIGMAIGGLAVVLALGVAAFVVLTSHESEQPTGTASAASSASTSAPLSAPELSAHPRTPKAKLPPPPPHPKGPWKACALEKASKRLVVGGSATVPPVLLPVPDEDQIAVAFAARNETAVGFVVNMGSLKLAHSYSKRQGGKIRRVTPIFLEGSVTYRADIADSGGPLKHLFTLGGAQPLSFGSFQHALTVSTRGQQTPKVLWKLPFEGELEQLWAQRTGAYGTAILLRSRSSLWIAWLDNELRSPLEPTPVEWKPAHLGRCATGWNGYQLLAACGYREKSDGPWSIRTLQFTPGQAKPRLGTIGPKGAKQPAISGLNDGRWLLSWTAASKGKAEVEGQTFDPDLAPLGDKWTIKGRREVVNSGLGAARDRALVVYAASIGKLYQVAGRVLNCR